MTHSSLWQVASFFFGQFLVGGIWVVATAMVDPSQGDPHGHRLNAFINLALVCSILTTPGFVVFAMIILARVGRRAPQKCLWLSALTGALSALMLCWGAEVIEAIQRLMGWEENSGFMNFIFGSLVIPISGALIVTHYVLRERGLVAGGFPLEQ